MRDITKRFGSVVANDRVWLDIYRGEVLALLGENGSGKTTLMNMLSGIYYPDEGQILIDGEEVVIRSPRDAYRYGIGMIHQHFKLVDVFTAAENITLGLDEKLDLKATAARIRSICERYGFDLDPNQKIYDMSVSQKQTVEIVKALYRGADILILDEPTAVLTPQETDKLFAVLRSMRDDGKAIVIITHKMHEVEALSDRVAVLRHGQFVGDMLTKDTDAQEMTNMMVGHAVTLNIDRPDPVDPKPRIEVKNLTVRSIDGIVKLDDVSSMIDGVNDHDWQADLLAEKIRGMPGHVNLIPLNDVVESEFKPSRRVAAFQKRLESHGLTATVRRSLGGDIDASCGQLRRKELKAREEAKR